MKLAFLKKVRVVIAILFFASTLFLFVDFAGLITIRFLKSILYLQFVPSLLSFISLLSLASAGFIFILLLTLLSGRVYCSAVCPLGIFQDIISRIARRFKRKKHFRYRKPLSWVWYSILFLTVVFAILLNNLLPVNLLDPYSLFGKMSTAIFRPAVYGINNLVNHILNKIHIFYLYPVPITRVSVVSEIFAGAFMLFLIAMAAWKGRWYCNTICPVGSLLGLCSELSLFKISIDETKCISCGKCSMICKAGCIDFKNKKVDFSRCVACFDCFDSCPENGITYRRKIWKKVVQKTSTPEIPGGQSRRVFLKTMIAGVAGTGALAAANKVFAAKSNNVSQNPASPPGSLSYWHYTDHCTACHLCVSACPTHVLQPSFMEFGLTGLFQPKMDYTNAYCNFECVKCSEICPTGAILPLTKQQKVTVQIGVSHYIKNQCIVVRNQTSCGACSEYCPTKAITMVPYLDDLMIPNVDERLCVGCGGCEYACPATPDKAIYVEALLYHRKAIKPQEKIKESKKETGASEDFPF